MNFEEALIYLDNNKDAKISFGTNAWLSKSNVEGYYSYNLPDFCDNKFLSKENLKDGAFSNLKTKTFKVIQ